MHRTFPAVLVVATWAAALGQEPYKKPPKEILDVLNAPVTPSMMVSPTRDHALLVEPLAYHSIADIAQPFLRLAGIRINPNTNGEHPAYYFVGLSVMKLPEGSVTKVALPAGFKGGYPEWSPDGKRVAFTNLTPAGIELWVCDLSAKVRRLGTVRVNAVLGNGVDWMPDSRTLLVQTVPAGRGKPPQAPAVPAGPNIQETAAGKGTVMATFQDLLKNAHDENLFDYYATAQLALVDTVSGATTPVGKPAIFRSAAPSPDGRHLLVARVHRPYSYLYPWHFFPHDIEIWDRAGRIVHKVASLPLADNVPMDGVPVGPRNCMWRATEPSTLIWVEALDGGDPKAKAPHRDRVLMLKAPFSGAPAEVVKLEQRYMGMMFLEKDAAAIVSDFERERRWVRRLLIRPDTPSEAPKLLWSRDLRDRYNDPGTPVMRRLPNGYSVVRQAGDGAIFLTGQGATPQGDRPFFDRFSLATLKSERLFQSDASGFESIVTLLDDAGTKLLTRRESPKDPPNYYVRTLGASGSLAAITKFPDPAPQLRGITKQLVRYKRADGVDLSFTLYLPPGYQKGTRLPTVVWAYPLEYNDPATAGQVVGSPQRFTMIRGSSHLFYLLRGYAVLDSTTMPVVGDFKTVNDTYVDQIVASAKAAIDKAAELGVTDPDRVGVGGHSYGAFMTANLLAHCDLFRAGVARSGAYNRTLTPFGFQSERRTLWEAPETYIKMSPFLHANKIKEPILLIHGEADDNSGTFPIQSERMYSALRATGGTVRLVTLPSEAHGYMGRESIEHVLYEMMSWFDRYVKDAPPRTKETAQ